MFFKFDMQEEWTWNISINYIISSNINEVIRAVLNFLFYEKISHAKKAQKSTKKH